MKKLLSIIITFVFVFGAYSCGGVEIAVTDTAATTEATTAEQSAVFKPFEYGVTPGEYMFSFDNGGYAVKYDVHSGKKSSVCPDPFCDHRTDKCPFFGITKEALTSIGDIVYYAKQDDSSGKGTVYSFDVNSGETKTVFARDGYSFN